MGEVGIFLVSMQAKYFLLFKDVRFEKSRRFLREKDKKGKLCDGIEFTCKDVKWFETNDDNSVWLLMGETTIKVDMENITDIVCSSRAWKECTD